MAKNKVENTELVNETLEVNGNVTSEEVSVTNEVKPATDKAYSIVFEPTTKKWLAVEVLFNYEAGTLGGVRVVEQNTSKQIITERFHVLIGNNLL